MFSVCYVCGTGAHERNNLFRNGQAPDAEGIVRTVYACAQHRGLTPQATEMRY